MGKIIAIANQKGGVGKSTTAINLSACLADQGKRVLTIDVDPQGNTTSGLGIDKTGIESSLYHLLIGEEELKDVLIEDVFDNLDLIPSNISLSEYEPRLAGVFMREKILANGIEAVKDDYDYEVDYLSTISDLISNLMN